MEEQSPSAAKDDEDDDEEQLDHFEEVSSEFGDEENVDSDDDQEIKICKPVQISQLQTKLTLNDYVFDEKQNLHEGLMQFDLKNMINKTNRVEDISNLMSPKTRLNISHESPLKMNSRNTNSLIAKTRYMS